MTDSKGAEFSPRNVVSVRLEQFGPGYTTGLEMTKQGESLRLKDVVNPEPMLGGGAFTEVYFRTESGNIYRLDRSGELVNAGESKKRGVWFSSQLDPKKIEDSKLTVGKAFRYGATGLTTRIVEIVPANSGRVYAESATVGMKHTNIVKDFKDGLPRKPRVDDGGFMPVTRD